MPKHLNHNLGARGAGNARPHTHTARRAAIHIITPELRTDIWEEVVAGRDTLEDGRDTEAKDTEDRLVVLICPAELEATGSGKLALVFCLLIDLHYLTLQLPAY